MYPFFAVFIISFISLFCFLIFSFFKTSSYRLSSYFISLAVGCLLGDAFFHLIPQSIAGINNNFLFSLLLTFGFSLFFLIEKFFFWHHCHDSDCHPAPIAALSFIGDTVHNFIDGLLIASSFSISPSLGFSTTLAVFLHEIPQEISDFGILIHQGFSLKKSLVFNLLSSVSAFAGVIFVFIVGTSFSQFSTFLLPVTAGGFIYLAATDLLPSLHHHSSTSSISFFQSLLIFLGVFLMSLLTFLE